VPAGGHSFAGRAELVENIAPPSRKRGEFLT